MSTPYAVLLPPGAAMEAVYFTSLSQMCIEDLMQAIDRQSDYRLQAAQQWAMQAAHYAREWHIELRGPDEPLPAWVRLLDGDFP
jgi:hypothetical protein